MKKLIDKLESLSLSHGLVNSFEIGDSVFEHKQNYPLIYVTPITVKLEEPLDRYNLAIYYIDNANTPIQSQSYGIRVINDILRELDEEHGVKVLLPTLNIFQQKFKEETVGVFGNVEISTFTGYELVNTIKKIEFDEVTPIKGIGKQLTLDSKELELNNKNITL